MYAKLQTFKKKASWLLKIGFMKNEYDRRLQHTVNSIRAGKQETTQIQSALSLVKQLMVKLDSDVAKDFDALCCILSMGDHEGLAATHNRLSHVLAQLHQDFLQLDQTSDLVWTYINLAKDIEVIK